MLRLYIDEGTRRMIDVSNSEQDIIDTMGEYIKENPDSRFLIIEHTDECDSVKARVIGYIEYAIYVEQYNERLKNMSCVELKKEIVKNQKVKTKTNKRLK